MSITFTKSDLKAVYKNTIDHFREKSLVLPKSEKLFWNDLGNLNLDGFATDTCDIDIENEDSFNLSVKYEREGLKPLVLNMANAFVSGGAVADGQTAQEEELFRRSNARFTHPSKMYPLETTSVIYSPEVTIIKASRDKNYEMLEHEVKVGMIACAAIREPALVNKKYSSSDSATMSRKIESIFRVGLFKGHDSLVLGAFGCGVFRNPPEEVARLFKAMVDKYGKYYKRIGFAILVTRPTDMPNIDAFNRAFGKSE